MLTDLFESEAIESFGKSLRISMFNDDYASLTELEWSETPEDFAEKLKNFLKRFESLRRKKKREGINLKIPSKDDLNQIIRFIEDENIGVRNVRVALIARCLVKRGEDDG